MAKKLLEAYDREQADRLLLLGDILYHGPRNTWLYDAGRGWYQMENIRRKDLSSDGMVAYLTESFSNMVQMKRNISGVKRLHIYKG